MKYLCLFSLCEYTFFYFKQIVLWGYLCIEMISWFLYTLTLTAAFRVNRSIHTRSSGRFCWKNLKRLLGDVIRDWNTEPSPYIMTKHSMKKKQVDRDSFYSQIMYCNIIRIHITGEDSLWIEIEDASFKTINNGLNEFRGFVTKI